MVVPLLVISLVAVAIDAFAFREENASAYPTLLILPKFVFFNVLLLVFGGF